MYDVLYNYITIAIDVHRMLFYLNFHHGWYNNITLEYIEACQNIVVHLRMWRKTSPIKC